MQIQYFPRTVDDAERFRVALDLVCRERRFLYFLEAPPVEGVRAFTEGLAARRCPQWIACDGGTVVGWADIDIGSPAVGTSHTGRLGMGIIAGYRGQGIGRQLLTRVLDEARERGLERIELGVFGSNEPARKLYESAGFTHEGVQRRARCIDGIYEDILCMALFLK